MEHSKKKAVKEVAASDFKNEWYAYLDLVTQGREEIVLTRYGKAIARLVPFDDPETPDEHEVVFGRLKGTVTIHGDIVGPIDEVWDEYA